MLRGIYDASSFTSTDFYAICKCQGRCDVKHHKECISDMSTTFLISVRLLTTSASCCG